MGDTKREVDNPLSLLWRSVDTMWISLAVDSLGYFWFGSIWSASAGVGVGVGAGARVMYRKCCSQLRYSFTPAVRRFCPDLLRNRTNGSVLPSDGVV